MEGLTLHIASEGFAVPSTNTGSNPLALGSEFYLGPDLDIFGLDLSPDVGTVHFDDIFDPGKNGLMVEVANADLTVVHGTKPDAMTPTNVIVRVGGVCYKLPLAVSRRIKARRMARVHWLATTGERGSFRFLRAAPSVF